AKALVGVQQDGLALERLLAAPKRLCKAAIDQANRGQPPARLAREPAALEIACEQLKRRQIELRLRIVWGGRERSVQGREGFLKHLQMQQDHGLVVEHRMKIRAKRQRPVETGKGLLQPAKSPMQEA